MTPIELGQVPLGMRLPVDFIPDAAVDIKSTGDYASVTVTTGDATSQVATGSTPLSWRCYFNGDGAIGLKSATVAVDGHVDSVAGKPGPVDIEVTQVVNWEVVSKDATAFTATIGKLEPIPVPVVPPPAAAAAAAKK